jgi:DNA helicase-2/ATP-dependent DNA helicase PcrA
MKFFADFHTHSHFSRATSKTLIPENLALWAQKKGITVIGTGDLTHPGWMDELKEKLVVSEDGLLKLKPELQKRVDDNTPSSCSGETRFVLSGEISCIYKKGGRTRKLHHLVLMPNMVATEKFNKILKRLGNISSDGRPILGISSKDLLEIVLHADPRAFFIPAHIWTPWFSLFGSRSGYDSVEECFEDLTKHIHALETGLSSDPYMNRLISSLDRYTLVSNSDAHSPGTLGREANIFDTKIEYDHMVGAMTHGDGFLGTIEFFSEKGKYHLDGHRKCHVCLEPKKTMTLKKICPLCGNPLTVGVLNRVLQLSDRKAPKPDKQFINLLPLKEILSELMGCGPKTLKVARFYETLIEKLGPELEILINVPLGDLKTAGGPEFAEAINRMRQNSVIRKGGYDGQLGTIQLFSPSKKAQFNRSPLQFTEPAD